MPDITIEVEIWCGTCGAGLCRQSSDNSKPGRPGIAVEVCRNCLNEVKRTAYDEGYTDGFNEGNNDLNH